MVTLSALLQAPVQALLRPSMWLPCLHRLHSAKELWRVDVEKADFIAALLTAVKALADDENNTEWYDIHKISEEKGFVRLFAFTRAEWLDVVEIQYCNDGLYEVRSFSSGLCPLIVPFAFLINLPLFWVPFYDSAFNQMRLHRIRDKINVAVTIVDNTQPQSD